MSARKAFGAEEDFRRMEAVLRAGFWIYDLHGRGLYWSPGLYALLGLKPESVMPDLSLGIAMIHPEDQRDWSEIVAQARKARHVDRVIRVIRPDGQMVWLRGHSEGRFDRNGSLSAVFGVMIDVSEQEAEREMAAKDRAFAESIRELTRGVIWTAGPDGKLANTSSWSRLTGETPEQARDWSSMSAIHPEDRERFRLAWRNAISQNTPVSYQCRVRDKSGTYTNYHTRAMPIFDDAGALVEWHGYSLPFATSEVAATGSLTSTQVRAARAMLEWTGPDLAERSGVSFSTVKRMEKSQDLVKPESVRRVRATLEAAGIRFSHGAGGDLTVTLVAPSPNMPN